MTIYYYITLNIQITLVFQNLIHICKVCMGVVIYRCVDFILYVFIYKFLHN